MPRAVTYASPPSVSTRYTLLLDASAPRVQVVLFRPQASSPTIYYGAKEPALTSLFRGISHCLAEADETLEGASALHLCAGPGSTLGLRIAATLAKTLLREATPAPTLHLYNALDLAAHFLAPVPEIPLVAPYKVGKRLLRLPVDASPIGQIQILAEDDPTLQDPQALHLPGRKTSSPPPTEASTLHYDLSRLPSDPELLAPILRPADTPEIFSPEAPEFRKWTPARNLAP